MMLVHQRIGMVDTAPALDEEGLFCRHTMPPKLRHIAAFRLRNGFFFR
jgi:hypothetical protein